MQIAIIRSLKLVLIFSALTSLLGNSGCLVETGSDLDKIHLLDQAHLRIYKANDYIEYETILSGNDNVNTKGKIRITWSQPQNIIDLDPLTAISDTNNNLLKETTTMEINGADTITVVRYITQDQDPQSPTYGTVTVHAFNSYNATDKYYYANSQDVVDSVTPVAILPSPLLDQNLNPFPNQEDFIANYFVSPDCTSATNSCAKALQRYNETMELSRMTGEEVETKLGLIQALRFNYHGTVTDADNSNQYKIRLDSKAFCGSATDSTIGFSGYQYIYPNIGVINFQTICTGINVYEVLIGAIKSTNIPY